MNMSYKSVISNVVWSIANIIIIILIRLLLTPYIVEYIGVDAYGYVSLATQFLVFVNLLSATINIYANRFISIEYHKGNYEKANRYFNSVLIANFISVCIIVVPSTFFIFYIQHFIQIPDNLQGDIKILFFITLISYFVRIIGTGYDVATFIMDSLSKKNGCLFISNIIQAIILILLFVLFIPRVWYVAIAALIATLFVFTSNIYFTRKLTPQLRIVKGQASVLAIKELFFSGIWNSIANLGTSLNTALDLFVTNIFLGATLMGELAIAKSLSATINTLITAVDNSFRPQILKRYSYEDHEGVINGLTISMKCCGLVSSICFVVVLGCGKQFISLWLPGQNIELIYRLTVLVFVGDVLSSIAKPLHFGLVLSKKLKAPCIASLSVGLFNAASMIILLKISLWGIYVIVLTTILGNITYNFILMPRFLRKALPGNLRIITRVLIMFCIALCVAALLALFITTVVAFDGWLGLIIIAALISTSTAGVYFLIMFSRQEKRSIIHGIINRYNITR